MKRLLLVAVLLAAGCGSDDGATTGPAGAELASMTIRLGDLPDGFVRGDDAGCGLTATTEGHEPDQWLAHVYYDDVVVAVNMAYGLMSAGLPGHGPYNSRKGMEAVVKGLRRRD